MIQYPDINPVALNLGALQIHWYGIMYLVGFGSAWLLGKKRAKHSVLNLTDSQVSDLIFYCAIGVILGGRTGYVLFYHFDYFFNDPVWLFKVWEGGMSFHGGLIGVLISTLFITRKWNLKFFDLTDFIAPLTPLALAAGRLGNFIGGELWGRASNVPWAMVFPNDPQQIARHPSQLYQFMLEGILLFVLLWIFSSKVRPKRAVSAVFLIGYGICRFGTEFFRNPDQQLGFIAWDWLTMGQLLTLPMIFIGSLLLLKAYRS